MFVTKLKTAIAVVLVLGVVGAGGTSLAYRTAAGQDGKKPTTDDPTGRTAAVQDGKKPGAEKPQEGNKPSSKDLGKIEPPGGVPLPLVKPGTKRDRRGPTEQGERASGIRTRKRPRAVGRRVGADHG